MDQARTGTLRCVRLGRAFDVAVSMLPTAFGPSLLLRLPDASTRPARLDKLGAPTMLLQAWVAMSSATRGLLLVTGPTASGKSTTLHATLREQLRDDRMVATVEDPLVHVLDGVIQTRLDSASTQPVFDGPADLLGIDGPASTTVRRAAVDAAIAGRLVIAAVATTDVAATLNQWRSSIDDDCAMSSALTGVLSQRLVRKLCPACKEAAAPTEADLRFFAGVTPVPEVLFTPRGCPQCNETGYLGRTAPV